jgi:hypothetical protein
MKFVITIDTEEDGWGDYSDACSSVENIGQLPVVQKIFNRVGAVPTYLIDYPAVSDEAARRILSKFLNEGRCEIGMHCHPWNTPPLSEERNEFNSMLCNLPGSLVRDKLSTLDNAIQRYIGVKPTCFRAGRWGFDSEVAKSIRELRYSIDSSVTPLISWDEYQGPDYESAPLGCYRFEPSKILSQSLHGELLEVPPTINFLRGDHAILRVIRRKILNSSLSRLRLLGLLDKTGIISLRWLSPELSTLSDMICLIRKAIRSRTPLLNFTFHSNSLLPGKTPFVRTVADREAFLNSIHNVLEFAASHGAEFITLSGALSDHRIPNSAETDRAMQVSAE